MITYKKVKIKLLRDPENICFPEIAREGFKEGQIVEADHQINDGIPTKKFWFENCVAYEGSTAEIVNNEFPAKPN